MIDRNFMRAVGIIELAGMINVQPVDVPMLLRVPGAVNGAGTAGVQINIVDQSGHSILFSPVPAREPFGLKSS